MSDGIVGLDDTPNPAVKDIPQDTGGTGSAAPESSQDGQDRAGEPQGSPEGGSADDPQNRIRGKSVFSKNRELRQQMREQEAAFNSRFQELEARLEKTSASQNGNGEKKPSKTFWEAPDEVTREITREEFKAMREDLLNELRTERTASQETHEWQQETSEAAKLIQSQRGMTQEDIQDIAEIVRSKQKSWYGMRPLERAETALLIWQKEKGITDKSELKAKASSFTGAPPGPGGKRQWTESEMEREVKKFPVDPGKWTDAQKKEFDTLDAEFKDALLNGRVRK